MKKKGVFHRKSFICMILVIIFVIASASWITPLAFARDGLLTRKKVESFKAQFDLGSTRRHNADSKKIYLLYFGFKTVKVEEEIMFNAKEVKVKKVIPFLYEWEWTSSSAPAYRVSIGEDKYYYTIVVT